MGGDFVVESKGHCFLCLNNTQSPYYYSPVKQKTEPNEHVSVHSLSRYLKLDMKKVFIDWELIPQNLMKEVEKARLKVELCLSCAGLIGKFSRLSRLLEKIEMEMSSSVELIHQTLVNAEREGKLNQLRNLATEEDGWADKLRILDVIRNDAIQKCSQKLRASLPRIKTLNMTVAKISKEKSKFKPKTPLLKIEPISSPANLVKVENSPNNYTSDDRHDGDGEMNYGQDDWDMQDEDFTNEDDTSTPTNEGHFPSNDNINSKHLEMEARPTLDSSSSRHEFCEEVIPPGLGLPSNDIPNSCPNPITGKHNCSICSKEFLSVQRFQLHYKNVHLKIKYKCKVCEKMFTQRANCWSHYRGVRMGVAYKCASCGKIFTDKSNLNKHLKVCNLPTR